ARVGTGPPRTGLYGRLRAVEPALRGRHWKGAGRPAPRPSHARRVRAGDRPRRTTRQDHCPPVVHALVTTGGAPSPQCRPDARPVRPTREPTPAALRPRVFGRRAARHVQTNRVTTRPRHIPRAGDDGTPRDGGGPAREWPGLSPRR